MNLIGKFTKLIPAAAVVLAGPVSAGLLTTSAVAPNVNGEDIAYLVVADIEEKLWTDTRAIGQSFTTGAVDVLLSAITLQLSEGFGKDFPRTAVPATKNYTLTIGSVSGTNYSAFATDTFTQNGSITPLHYFTMTLATPVALSANTTYGFDLAMTSSTTDWGDGIPYMFATSNDGYSGGQQFRSTANKLSTPTIGFINGDKVFHLDLNAVSVPEPSSLALFGAAGGLLLLSRRRASQKSPTISGRASGHCLAGV